jgi:hypothetical protein
MWLFNLYFHKIIALQNAKESLEISLYFSGLKKNQ